MLLVLQIPLTLLREVKVTCNGGKSYKKLVLFSHLCSTLSLVFLSIVFIALKLLLNVLSHFCLCIYFVYLNKSFYDQTSAKVYMNVVFPVPAFKNALSLCVLICDLLRINIV